MHDTSQGLVLRWTWDDTLITGDPGPGRYNCTKKKKRIVYPGTSCCRWYCHYLVQYARLVSLASLGDSKDNRPKKLPWRLVVVELVAQELQLLENTDGVSPRGNLAEPGGKTWRFPLTPQPVHASRMRPQLQSPPLPHHSYSLLQFSAILRPFFFAKQHDEPQRV